MKAKEACMKTRVEEAVALLIHHNCRHKKTNVFTGQAQWIDIIPHMVKEIKELNEALAEMPYECVKLGKWLDPHVLEELADIYGILVHAVLKAGYSMDRIETQCLLKFRERFDDVGLLTEGDVVHSLVYLPSLSGECTDSNTQPADNSSGSSSSSSEEGCPAEVDYVKNNKSQEG